MTKELNTLLTALYVLIDDHVVAARVGRGRQPLLSDSELITLAVAQVLQGYHCERRWIRHLRSSPQWRAMFPYLPGQLGYHKCVKNAQPLLCKAILTPASCCPAWFDDMWMTDATPVPCGMSRETTKRSDLAGHAGYGYCASHSRYYWGLEALPGVYRRRDGRSCGAWPAGSTAAATGQQTPPCTPSSVPAALGHPQPRLSPTPHR